DGVRRGRGVEQAVQPGFAGRQRRQARLAPPRREERRLVREVVPRRRRGQRPPVLLPVRRLRRRVAVQVGPVDAQLGVAQERQGVGRVLPAEQVDAVRRQQGGPVLDVQRQQP